MEARASIVRIQSNVALKNVSLSSKRCLSPTLSDASLLRGIRRGSLGPPRHKRAAFLATAKKNDDIALVAVKRCNDGSQIFTFGPNRPDDDAPPRMTSRSKPKPESETPRPTAKAEPETPRPTTDAEPAPSSRPRTSGGYMKRSTVPKSAPRTEVPSSKPAEAPPSKAVLPPRAPSSFAKRSPIQHSSTRAPASEDSKVPVAVSPRVTPASDGMSAPGDNARLTGVRERSEAPIPTQDRLRSKGTFKKGSPVLGRARQPSARLVAPTEGSEDGKLSSDGPPARGQSSYSKKSPLAKKSSSGTEGPDMQEVEARKPAAPSSPRPERPASSFQKPTSVSGHPPRKVVEQEAVKEEEASRPERLASAFKRSSPQKSAVPKGARQPGARAAPKAAADAVMNGVAQAAGNVQNAVKDVVSAVTGAQDSNDEASSGLDLQSMRLADLREVAKERKVKGMWSMKKAELIEALQVSFSEDV